MNYGATNNIANDSNDSELSVVEDDTDSQTAFLIIDPSLQGLRRPSISDTTIGKLRPWRDTDRAERVFLLFCGVLLLTSFIFACVHVRHMRNPDFSLSLVLLFNTVFSTMYVVLGVRRKREFQIVIFILATLLVWLHIVINFIFEERGTYETARLIVGCVATVIAVPFSGYLIYQYASKGDFVYRVVLSAIKTKRAPYSRYLLLLDLLLFNAQLSLNLMILSHDFLKTGLIEGLEIGLWTCFTLIFALLGYFSISRERPCATAIFFCLIPLEMAYIIYRTVWISWTDTGAKDTYLEVCTYVCGTVTAVCLGMILLLVGLMRADFGEGLIDIRRPKRRGDRPSDSDDMD